MFQLTRPIGRAIIIIALAGAPWPAPGDVRASQLHVGDTFEAAVRLVSPDPRTTPVDTIEIDFSAPVDRSTLTVTSLELTRATGFGIVSQSLPVAAVATLNLLNAHTLQIANLRVLTAPDGRYRLTLRAAGISDVRGRPLAADASEEWLVDTLGPLVVALGPVTPDPRTDAVDSVDVRFSEPISPTSFTAADVVLTRDGLPLDMAAAEVARVGDTSYRIGNLAALTAARGAYVLTVSPEGIADALGNIGDRAFARTDRWAVVVRPGVLAVGPVTPSPRSTALDSVDVRFSEPISPTSFTTADLALTRDGLPLPLTAVSVVPLEAGLFRVAGLGALTGQGGVYRLAVDAAGVLDLDDGAVGAGSGAVSWTTDTSAPRATLSVADVTVAGGSAHLLSVTYQDNLALDERTLGDGDIVVTGPGGAAAPVALVDVRAPGETRRIAIYRVGAPGGTWDSADNGTYRVSLASGEIHDAVGNSAAPGVIGSFTVAAPAPGPTPRQYLPVVAG